MARRSPRNPLSDIVDAAGAWLGGNRGTVNPQVERVTRDLVRAAAAADAVTGGFGAAAARDIQNFAQGGSLPTNLAKTAAVNLAAGAVGAGAAQVAAKTAGKVATKIANKRMGDVAVSLIPQNTENVVYHSSSQNWMNPVTNKSINGEALKKVGSASNPDYLPVHLRPGRQNFHAGTLNAATDRLENSVSLGGHDYKVSLPGVIDRYEIVDRSRMSGKPYFDDAISSTKSNYKPDEFVQTYDNASATPGNKILTYTNQVEDVGSTSVLIPKNLVGGNKPAVVYRGTANTPLQKDLSHSYRRINVTEFTSPRMAQISQSLQRAQANIDRATPDLRNVAAGAAFSAPKKNARGGGKNKR